MKVFVAGGTGFLGPHMINTFLRAGHQVVALVRHRLRAARLPQGVEVIYGNPLEPGDWQEICAGCDVTVNLTGASIFARWTPARKALIRETRLRSTANVIEALARAKVPRLLLNASAVGFYGADRGEEELTEESSPGHDFLAEVCQAWEEAALSGTRKGLRVCAMRLGVVLGPGGGALGRMLPAFRLGLGGTIGSGRQWFPWVHVEDVAQGALFLATTRKARGPFNFVAPGIVRHREFAKALGKVLRRPASCPVPAWFLRLIFGEMASILTGSLKVRPQGLLDLGYRFSFPTLEPALKDILR